MYRYRLSFVLPADLAAVVRPGPHALSDDLKITVGRGGDFVQIDGPSRDSVMEDAERFFRILLVGRRFRSSAIPANLFSEPMHGHYAKRDAYQILLKAEIAIVPGGLGPDRLAG